MNGDLGLIKRWDAENKQALMSLDDGEREIWVPKVNLDSWVPAWASTIHRFQGSEAPCCVLLTSTAHYTMNTRSLLYTAVTRARELCVVLGHAEDDRRGPKAAIDDCRRKADTVARRTLLARRINDPSVSGTLF